MIWWEFNMKKSSFWVLSWMWGDSVGGYQSCGGVSWGAPREVVYSPGSNTCASSSILTTVFVTRPCISNGICPNLESPVKNDQDNWILKIVVLEWWVRSQEGYDSGWCINCSFKCLKGARRKMGYLSSLWLQRVEFWPGGRIIEKYISS